MKWTRVLTTGVVAAGVLAGSASAFAATTSPATPATAAPASCLPAEHDDAWPAWTQGRPDSFDPGDTGGVYMWHDTTGWHVRVTHTNDDKAVFTGRITTPKGHLDDVTAVALEHNDKLAVSEDKQTVTFMFANYGHVDGFDFRTTCAPTLVAGFARGHHRLPVDRVFIGDHKAHPATDPVRISRIN